MAENINVAEEVLNLTYKLQNFCQDTKDKEFNKEVFSIKFKILFLIKKLRVISPKVLTQKLNMAKSNMAFFCKRLLQENLITATQDDVDHRVVYYCLTSQGAKYVDDCINLLNEHICQNFEKNKLKNIGESTYILNEIFD